MASIRCLNFGVLNWLCMIPQVRGFQGCYLDNHRNNGRCARAVRKRPVRHPAILPQGTSVTILRSTGLGSVFSGAANRRAPAPPDPMTPPGAPLAHDAPPWHAFAAPWVGASRRIGLDECVPAGGGGVLRGIETPRDPQNRPCRSRKGTRRAGGARSPAPDPTSCVGSRQGTSSEHCAARVLCCILLPRQAVGWRSARGCGPLAADPRPVPAAEGPLWERTPGASPSPWNRRRGMCRVARAQASERVRCVGKAVRLSRSRLVGSTSGPKARLVAVHRFQVHIPASSDSVWTLPAGECMLYFIGHAGKVQQT